MTATDLFESPAPAAPLAERLRPKHIDEVIGQSHLLGPGRPLRLAFDSGKLHSMILWGPPGVGKTTLARLMATRREKIIFRMICRKSVFTSRQGEGWKQKLPRSWRICVSWMWRQKRKCRVGSTRLRDSQRNKRREKLSERGVAHHL